MPGVQSTEGSNAGLCSMNSDCLQGKLRGHWNVAREEYGSTGSGIYGSRSSSTTRHLSNPVDSCCSDWQFGTELAQGATPFFQSFQLAFQGLAPSAMRPARLLPCPSCASGPSW